MVQTHGIFRKARKTHRELHEEVFVTVKVSIEQPSSKPPGESKARRPTSSRTTDSRLALSQPPSSVSPVPPPPMSKKPSLRMSSHNAEARHVVSSTPPSEIPSQPPDQPTTSHSMRDVHPLLRRSDESIAPSNSLSSLNSNSRRDHGHSKQGLRPRDSLVLEKARHFDHLHTLRKVVTLWYYSTPDFISSAHNGRPSVVVDPAYFSVPPVPQLLNISHPQKLEHTRHPST